MTKKILTVSLTVALVATLIGGATMAWLSAKADLPEATLTAGTVNIEAGRSEIRHLGFTPGQTPDAGTEVIGNYAFIPNAEEASVSKVDLAAAPPAEVARYSTVQPRSGAAYGYPVYRVSRLAMDSQGNAWVLNSMTGLNDPSTRQGSVVRISGSPVAGEDTTIPNTSIAGGLAGMLDSDVRVTVFDVGAPGDCPRTINIVEEGGNLYLWIGFYMGEYFEKFAYDPTANTLTSTGQSINVVPYNAYTAVIDGNGILWGVSRNASPYPSPSGTPGVFYFDTNNLGAGVTGLPYDLPGKIGENPYAILLKSDGTVWVSDGSNWGTSQPRYFAVYTWGTPVTVQYVDTGVASPAMRGFMEDGDGNIWATSINGLVIKLTWDGANWTGATMISGLGELTGLGADAYGWFWVIQYGSDQMTRFDPDSPTPVDVSVALGDGPYAYGNFVQFAPPSYKICGYKFADWDDALIPLYGWEITLQKVTYNATSQAWDADPGFAPQTTTTDAEGMYCFTGLEAGNYTVSELLKPGWEQLKPVGNQYIVELPGDEYDPDAEYNFVNTPVVNCYDETAWAYGEDESLGGAEGDVAKHNNKVAGNPSTAWGWTNYFAGNETFPVVMDLWAAAGQNDLDNGFKVGTVTVDYVGDCVTVTYDLDAPYTLAEAHLWVGPTPLPTWEEVTRGRGRGKKPVTTTTTTVSTAAPGQFSKYVTADEFEFEPGETTAMFRFCDVDLDNEGGFWVAAHAVVEWCEYDWEILRLVSKNAAWEVIEGASGVLVFAPRGPEFEFVFAATGLAADTDYSLIYYADPWAGNNPGALIAYGTSDADGVLILEGSEDLNMNLPDPADANYADGAKIWLVPSADYNPVTNAMIAWNPTQYLFEDNLIRYYDTDIS